MPDCTIATNTGTSGASALIVDGQEITVSCAEGDIGTVYEGLLPHETETVDLGWNVLVPDPSGGALTAAVERPAVAATDAAPYGSGDAAERTVAALAEAARP